VRRWVWFIPISPPPTALNPATVSRIFEESVEMTIDRRNSGAIFCHVDKMRQFIHEIEDITDPYQK
jgi:hypothetical protein